MINSHNTLDLSETSPSSYLNPRWTTVNVLLFLFFCCCCCKPRKERRVCARERIFFHAPQILLLSSSSATMLTPPSHCRYGIHGDVSRHTNIDGTALYCTRERRCDCTPPPTPTPPPPRRVGPPTRPAATRAGRPRHPVSAPPYTGGAEKRQTATVTPDTAGPLHAPLEFYAGGPRVVVAPLAPVEEHDSAAFLPALPSIPVVWPQPSPLPDLTTRLLLHSEAATHVTPSTVEVSAVLTPPPPPLTPAVLEAEPAAAEPAAPLTAGTGGAAGACTAEQHALHARWGVAYCAECGVKLGSGNIDSVDYSPLSCPLGPHTSSFSSPPPSYSGMARGEPGGVGAHRYCLLCGAQLANAVETTTAATAATTTAGSSGGGTAQSCHGGVGSPPQGDALTRRDLQTVDEVMAHLLSNAAARGGKVQPPCGLPNCRLCEPALPSAASAPAGCGVGGEADKASPYADRWWGQPVLCGSPAVAIIHNHYYR